MPRALTLNRARSLFAAVWAGVVATPLGIFGVARNSEARLGVAGAIAFVLLMALFAYVATALAIRILGTRSTARYLLAVLLSDAIFAILVALAASVAIGIGSAFGDPDSVSLAAAVFLTGLVLFWGFVGAFVIAVPCSFLGALMFQIFERLARRIRARRVADVFVLLLAALTLPWAEAQPAAPTLTELLSFDGKADGKTWKLGDSVDRGGMLMQEFVPEGETVDNWSEMITIQTFKQRPDMNMQGLIARTLAGFRDVCANLQLLANNARDQTDELRAAAHLPATYHTYDTLVRCDVAPAARPPGAHVSLRKYEVVWFKGIQGWLSSYLVQRAWHGDTITPDSILGSDATRQRWQGWIDQIAISGAPDKAKP